MGVGEIGIGLGGSHISECKMWHKQTQSIGNLPALWFAQGGSRPDGLGGEQKFTRNYRFGFALGQITKRTTGVLMTSGGGIASPDP
jgi:hypothetical protein